MRLLLLFMAIMAPSFSLAAPAKSPKSMCEWLLADPQGIEQGSQIVREAFLIHAYRIDESNPRVYLKNPNISPVDVKLPQGSGLIIGYDEASKSLRLKFNDVDGRVAGRRLIPLLPLRVWQGVTLTPDQLKDVIDTEGDGLLQDKDNAVFEALVPRYVADDSESIGVVLDEFVNGIRSYLSFRADRWGSLEIVFGLDVPCARVDELFSPANITGNTSRALRILKLFTDEGEFCRVPQVVYRQPPLHGIDRL